MVVTLHGSDVRLARGALAARLFRAVAARAAAVTAVSSWLADETVRLTGAPRPLVAPMPIDLERFVPGQGPRDGLLFVGKLDAQKGLHVLLDALPRVDPARGPLTVVGDGPDRAALEAQAQRLGVQDRVTWLGALPQPALVPHYQRAGAVILPAAAPEGLGLVAMEARACGAPIVASAIGGLLDVAGDSPTARLVPPGDPVALAEAINAVPTPDPRAVDARVADFAPAAVAGTYAALYARVGAHASA
jgi:glycosyltransferase involved in cell wall biosynthesis